MARNNYDGCCYQCGLIVKAGSVQIYPASALEIVTDE